MGGSAGNEMGEWGWILLPFQPTLFVATRGHNIPYTHNIHTHYVCTCACVWVYSSKRSARVFRLNVEKVQLHRSTTTVSMKTHKCVDYVPGLLLWHAGLDCNDDYLAVMYSAFAHNRIPGFKSISNTYPKRKSIPIFFSLDHWVYTA